MTQIYQAINSPTYIKDRVKNRLKELGVGHVGMLRMASRYLPNVIHPDEEIMGVVYGRGDFGSAMLTATNRRVIYLDKKPLFFNEDEVTYDVVAGVKLSQTGFGSTVTLHTRVKDYTIHALNRRCAEGFVQYIESRCLEHLESEASYG